ncbi:MAG: hypothetical protein ACRDMI_08585 [Streptosporangiaceae bacterium]
MTSQRDETVGHRAGDEMTDDPIVVERHDEILGGPPADDPETDDASARDTAADDGTPAGYQPGGGTATDRLATDRPASDDLATDRPASDDLASDRPASDDLASDRPASDEPASDELVGRHAAPEAGTTGLEQDPPPLVVPPGPASGDPAAPSWAGASGGQAAMPEPEVPGTPGTGPLDAGPVDASTPATSPGEPAGGPNGDGIPAAALAGQQWPAIQAMFVDDPKGSVERAAAAADEVVKAFAASLQREQAALRAAWAKDTTTEDLRTALQQYRAFCGRLEGLA